MFRQRRSPEDSGFALPEVFVVVLLIAVLGAVAVPQLQESLQQYRLQASLQAVMTELDAARIMAVSRGVPYQIDWGQNWIQVVDPDDPENPPRVAKFLEEGISIQDGPPDPIVFYPRGYARGGTFTIGGAGGGSVTVEVTASGKIVHESGGQ